MFLAVFNGFLAVLSASTMKKARRRRKILEPLFLREIFHFRPTKFSFWSNTPLKKFGGDNV